MKIAMRVQMSGTRNGVPWPGVGVAFDLPEPEAIQLVQRQMAVPVIEPREEKAVPAVPVEVRHGGDLDSGLAVRPLEIPDEDELNQDNAPKKAPAQTDLDTVRKWARDKGYTVSAKGRLPNHVIRKYNEEH